SAADQREAARREVRDRRREVDLAVEPRAHRMLIGRRDVDEVIDHQRAHMTRDELVGETALRAAAAVADDEPGEGGGDGGAWYCGPSPPSPCGRSFAADGGAYARGELRRRRVRQRGRSERGPHGLDALERRSAARAFGEVGIHLEARDGV